MTYLVKPILYDQAGFQHLVSTLSWNKGWRPSFPTLHNTGVPSLKTYLGYGKSVHDRWGQSLNAYYRGMGWHSGPHVVCCPDGILALCNPEQDGVSVSCWNHVTFGIEMVLDGATEDFSSTPAAAVRDNAVLVIALLCNKLGWHPDPLVIGKSGLHFHHMCSADHHACPGKSVDRADIVARVQAKMAELRGSAVPVASVLPPVPDPTQSASSHGPAWAQQSLNTLGASPRLYIDGIWGPASKTALSGWLAKQGLPAGDGSLIPVAVQALQKAIAS